MNNPVVGEFAMFSTTAANVWPAVSRGLTQYDPPVRQMFKIMAITAVAAVGPWPYTGTHVVEIAAFNPQTGETSTERHRVSNDDLDWAHDYSTGIRKLGDVTFLGAGADVVLSGVRVSYSDKIICQLKTFGVASKGAYLKSGSLEPGYDDGEVTISCVDATDASAYTVYAVSDSALPFGYTSRGA